MVDDNRVNRIKITHMLEQQGHDVILATDGREALERLGTESFDVVLLDLLMPQMDGFEVLQRIKSDVDLRDVIVIVISALDEMSSIVHCIEMGAEDYLLKPFDPVLLRARLKTSLEKKQLRDLERAYLQQEMMLHQSEKLATLGKLSAGVAHELNNPAAAARRSASQLSTAISRLQQAQLHLETYGLSATQEAALMQLLQSAAERAREPLALDALAHSDRQEKVEQWLRAQGVNNGWEYASDLVQMGYDGHTLGRLGALFATAQLPAIVAWIAASFTLYSLAQEIGDATGRISEIINALKSYTYMDQAPMQRVDIHEGLESTLTILRHKLRQGIQVEREFDPELPPIDGYGGELNQVWTNLIDNAITAMDGKGKLTLRTRHDNGWVIVEVEDTGPGIPETIQSKIFDPFFTTKAPGEGTGLGLNFSHNVVVQKHGGRLSVRSLPGRTCFEVSLPRTPAK